MKREQGKKASQKSKAKFNALCVAAAQGQARSSVWRRQTRLKRHDKFTPSGKANSRQIQAKFSQAKKAFFKS
ncbi:hypothetical protein Q6T43_000040 [Campylobacter upsaliensis]|nr:hypothetical protein [Campylobacter upsaliensis]